MNRKLFFLGSVILALLMTGCAKQPVEEAAKGPSAQQDVMALRSSVMDAYVNAYNAKDASGAASLYTADAVRMSPDQPATVGREAIEALYKAYFADVQKRYSQVTFSGTSNDAGVSGDLAYISGAFVWSGTPAGGGKPIEIKLKWVTVCQRQTDGAWKIARVCWNSDAPMPAPAKTK